LGGKKTSLSGRSDPPAHRAGGWSASAFALFDWSNSPLGPRLGWPQSLKTLTNLVVASKEPMCVVWGKDYVLIYNDAYERMIGGTLRGAFGRPVFDSYPETQATLAPLFERVFCGESISTAGSPLTLDRGAGPELLHFAFAYAPIWNDDGGVDGFFASCTEVTSLVAARDTLASQRDFLERLVQDTDTLILALDTDFRVMALNRANAVEFERVFGARPKVGDNLLDLIADVAAREQVRDAWSAGLSGEELTTIRRFGDPARDQPFYEITFKALRDEAGAVIGAYQFARDVTGRIRDQARLAQAQEALIQSRKLEAMGQLTGGVAHDFNNLLTPIVGSLDLLMRRELGGEREQRLIHGAYQSAERAKTLVQRLLAFARRQPLQVRPVDIGALVQGMGDLITSAVGPKVSVSLNIDPGAPAARADGNQLEMAILNLAINARDAMERGGALSIGVTSQTVLADQFPDLAAGGYVLIKIADTGAGMDEATLSRAIEPFYSTKGIGKGTGLGLSMAHGLASQLGGALTISSTPKVGTEVILWLPMSEAVANREGLPAATPATPAAGQTVLLVDDEPYVRAATADMLCELAFHVREAASAEEALAAIDAGLRPDVLVTDHLMPGMSGVELAYEVRARSPDTRILIISGFAEVDSLDPALPRLTKPFLHRDLAAAVADLQAG